VDPRVARSRRSVIAAGTELISEGGIRAFSIDSVAARSGVAKTTIYRHWATRSDLLADVVAALHDDRAGPDEGSLRADLRRLMRDLARELATEDWARGLTAIVGEAEHDEDLAALHRELVGHFMAPTRAALQRARDRGELAPDVDVGLGAELVYGALFYRRLVLHGRTKPAEVDRLVDLVYRALTPTNDHEEGRHDGRRHRR
jgi:AcrR family transcriptional regulator